MRARSKRDFIAAALISAMLIPISACAKKEAVPAGRKAEKNISGEKPMEIKQEVYSFRVEGFTEDKTAHWGLEGASATVVLDKININGLKAVYYAEDMTFTISADKAVYDKKTQDIELKENIVGRTSDGGELITTYAKWNARSEEIATDSPVLVKRENISCEGRGMVTRPRLNKVQFREEILVTIAPDKKILCDGPFELDRAQNIAIFNKNVRVIEKDSETLADKMTVYLNPDTNEIERIITEGNVEVIHRGDVEKIGGISF